MKTDPPVGIDETDSEAGCRPLLGTVVLCHNDSRMEGKNSLSKHQFDPVRRDRQPNRTKVRNTIAYWRKRRVDSSGRSMSQKELARLIGRSVDQIGRYERGSRKPTLTALFALGAALQVPPHALYPDLWQEAQRQTILRRRECESRQ